MRRRVNDHGGRGASHAAPTSVLDSSFYRVCSTAVSFVSFVSFDILANLLKGASKVLRDVIVLVGLLFLCNLFF
jgi:hypothetical protein